MKIAQTKDYEKHLNQHNVIHLNMQEFLSDADSITDMLEILKKELIYELTNDYDVDVITPNLKHYLKRIFNDFKQSFIFIIDEWDCIFKYFKQDKEAQEKYLDF